MSDQAPTPAPAVANPADAPRKRAPPRLVEVLRVQSLSPAMRRITLGGPELAGFPAHGPASYIKLIFPEPGQTEPLRPAPDGPRSTSMRTYTPREFRADAREMDVDFVLHGEGPASNWAAQAVPGQKLLLMGPGPGYKLDPGAALHWLIGDDSALPAFETILASLPAQSSAQVWLEVLDAREERRLASAASTQVHWLHRGNDNSSTGRALEAALRTLTAPPPEARIYVACEAAAMRRIRQQLVEGLGLARSQIVARGYWKLGAVNHPDHDYGDDA